MKRAMKFTEVDYEDYTHETHEAQRKKLVPFKKLVVPTRMRSIYWKYFGFPATDDGTILSREKIVCVICKSQMIYNRNTTNLRMHLNSRHKNVIRKLEIEDPDSTKRQSKSKNSFSRNSDFSNLEIMNLTPRKVNESKNVQVVMPDEVGDDISNIAIIFPNNEELCEYDAREMDVTVESTKISDAILNFVITDLISPDIIDGKGFHHLMSILSNKTVIIPNENKLIYDIIPSMYNTCKQQVYNNIVSNCITNISLSIEEWTCADNLKCLSIYMHYLQNGEPSLFSRLLTTINFTGSESIDNWEHILGKFFEEWSINASAITAILTSFSNRELEQALKLKKFVLLPCFLYLLQELCTKHCFSHHVVSKLLEKCRKIVKYVHQMKPESEQSDPLVMEDSDENDKYFLTYDRSKLWLTTYYMLRNLLRKKNMILTNYKFEFNEDTLNAMDWRIINDLVNLLEPLKTIVITLFEEKNSLISLLKPLIWKVNSSQFEINESDLSVIKDLKKLIKDVLNEAYTEENADNLTQIATTLDPRFKTFIQQEESFNCENSLTNLLTDLVETEGSLSPADAESSNDNDKNYKKRVSGINALFGSFCVNKPVLTIEDKIKAEISHYNSETSALLEECPLEWWQHMNNKCPNLIRLAHKYHCVPAIVLVNVAHSVHDYIGFYYKRASLKENVVDPLLFLHSNKSIL